VPNSNGRTALHLASIWGSEGAAKVLVSSGANLFARDALGLSPAHLAALNNQAPVLQLLLRGRQPAPNDITAIFNQTFQAGHSAPENSAVAIAAATDFHGRSVLHAAAYTCSISCCHSLLALKAPVMGLVDNCSRNALFWCVASQEHTRHNPLEECLRLLVDAGLAQGTDSLGRNALHFACVLGSLNAASILYCLAEDLARKPVRLSLSLARSWALLLRLLTLYRCLQYGRANRTLLHAALELRKDELFEYDDERMIGWLVQHLKFNPLQPDRNGVTPLHLAAHSGRIDALSVLLESIDPAQSVDIPDKLGRTPFHYATITNSVKVSSPPPPSLPAYLHCHPSPSRCVVPRISAANSCCKPVPTSPKPTTIAG